MPIVVINMISDIWVMCYPRVKDNIGCLICQSFYTEFYDQHFSGVLCIVFFWLDFFMLASGIYPRVEDNYWCILLVLVTGFSKIDGTALCSYFRHTHAVQFILDSRISGRFLSDCTESLIEGISGRNLPEQRHYWDGIKSASYGALLCMNNVSSKQSFLQKQFGITKSVFEVHHPQKLTYNGQ